MSKRIITKVRRSYSEDLAAVEYQVLRDNGGWEKQVDFNKYFDKLFLSHKLKMSKTQDEIWDKILPEIEFKPNELVFIDNKEKYLEPAKKLGINTILFLTNDQVKKELADLGVKVD